MLTLDERLERYAQAYAELDEQAHAFTADNATIKGVPPPNAPPIPSAAPWPGNCSRRPRLET